MRAKKSFGQHFLKDEHIAARIADALKSTDTYDHVLEVGPGKGMLTKYLIEKDYELTVVEADRDMVEILRHRLPMLNGNIVREDFLKTNLKLLFPERPFAIIGNFPYNISSQIVFKMLKNKEQVPELVGMFQKEMAERIVAPPGSKTYGVISVLVQAYYNCEMLFTVGPNSFAPPPKVKSAVIRLWRKEKDDLNCDPKLFKRVVKQAFSQRRKMLRNTMKSFIKGNPLLNNDFFNQRPEQLSVQDFAKLTRWVGEAMKN